MVSWFLLDLWTEDKIRKYVVQSILITVILNESQLFLFKSVKVRYTWYKATP